jgi:hypothetical protein
VSSYAHNGYERCFTVAFTVWLILLYCCLTARASLTFIEAVSPDRVHNGVSAKSSDD